jgi:hypothetical protein
MIYIASPDPDHWEMVEARYTVHTVDQDYDQADVYDLMDKSMGNQEFDDFADVVKFVEGYNDRYKVQRMLAYLGRETLTKVYQKPMGNPNATSDDFIDSDGIRSCIAHFNELLNANADIVLAMLTISDEPFSVDDRYCNHLNVNEPVLVCSTPEWTRGAICEYTDEVDLAFGHCNPYAEDDFDQASLEQVAEDLNNAFRYYWETLMEEAVEDMFKRFQQSRVCVRAFYDSGMSTDKKELALTYYNTFEEGMSICDSNHISIWEDEELIAKHGGKYHLQISNMEWVSDDRESLERRLFDHIQYQA